MVTIFSFDHMTGENPEYQYCNMAPMLSRQICFFFFCIHTLIVNHTTSILGVIFFVFKSLLVFWGIDKQKNLKNLQF